jgi:hypothetical protein
LILCQRVSGKMPKRLVHRDSEVAMDRGGSAGSIDSDASSARCVRRMFSKITQLEDIIAAIGAVELPTQWWTFSYDHHGLVGACSCPGDFNGLASGATPAAGLV